MLAASAEFCSRGGNSSELLCCTNSQNPCGSWPSTTELGERGIVVPIASGDFSDWIILVAAAVAEAEPSYS